MSLRFLFFLPSAAVYSTQVSCPPPPGAADAIRYSAFVLGLGEYLVHSWHPDYLNGLTAADLIDRHPLGWPRGDPHQPGRPR